MKTLGGASSRPRNTVPTPRSTDRERRALREISSAAQERMNLKRSWQKLEVELAANFTRRDLHLVFTYDDDHLPPSRAEAVKLLKKLIRLLRDHRKARGQETRYIYGPLQPPAARGGAQEKTDLPEARSAVQTAPVCGSAAPAATIYTQRGRESGGSWGRGICLSGRTLGQRQTVGLAGGPRERPTGKRFPIPAAVVPFIFMDEEGFGC